LEREIAIRIRGLKKRYRLGQIGGGTLQGDLQSWWARIHHREDPNLKIGEDRRSSGELFMALNGIDLDVYKGEALGIIGHNGAGKSTLLKILSRVTAPTEGVVDIYGRISSMLEVGTGFNGEMTGRENIYMNGAILGMTRAEIESKMEEIIDFSEVREYIDTPVKRYSSGMYVKLAFAVSAHLDSEIMVMDEVLAVGDMKFQKKCLGAMGDAASQKGRTVLYVSHNMNTIRQLCTRCIVMDQGRIIFDGDVERAIEIYSDAQVSELKAEADLDGLSRTSVLLGQRARMTRMEVLNQKGSLLSMGDRLRFRLGIRTEEEMTDLCFRCMVYYNDDTPVCMASTRQGEIYLSSGKGGELELELDSSHLAPGKYHLKMALYHVNSFGTEELLDVLDKAFYFEIENDSAVNGLIWLPQYWGHVSAGLHVTGGCK
jgi:lipopolysaccharide transport system ATP-binding protein